MNNLLNTFLNYFTQLKREQKSNAKKIVENIFGFFF